MTTVAVRGVTLNVVAPTLDDVIRGVIPAIAGDGDSVTFTIPDWVEIGDSIVVYAYNRVFSSFIPPTTGPNANEPISGWFRWRTPSDYTDDIYPYPILTIEFPGSSLDEFNHEVVSGDAGSSITFNYEHYDYYSATNIPTTFADPIACGVIFKGSGWGEEDGNYGGVAYDYDYDDASATYSLPYQVLVFWQGSYVGALTPPPVIGVTTLTELNATSSVYLGAKVVYGSGSAVFPIVAGSYGMWLVGAYIDYNVFP
jgi:hypothetical protein